MTDEKKVLILTLNAGGGHLQATKAKMLEHKELGHEVVVKEILRDLVGRISEWFVLNLWSKCQATGTSSVLFFFSISARTFDILIAPFFFSNLCILLYRNDFSEIIDTQPFGTKMVTRAIRFISWLKGKKIKYQKVLTDLPTEKCSHYLGPIKRLSKKDRGFIKIETAEPLIEKDQTIEDFWKEHTNLNEDNIQYKSFPLRKAFHTYRMAKRPLQSAFKAHSEEALALIKECIDLSDISYTIKDLKLHFTFNEESLSLITLGAYPNKQALIDYTKEYIFQKRKYSPNKKEVLFLLVGPEKQACASYKAIIKALKDFDPPRSLTILPLSFQDDQVLAPLYFNLDFIIAKSGGLTAMELLKAVKGHIFIHDDPTHNKSNFFSFFTKNLFDTMPIWERGNAEYLINKKGAKLINPHTFENQTTDFFLNSSTAQAYKQ